MRLRVEAEGIRLRNTRAKVVRVSYVATASGQYEDEGASQL